MNRYNYFFILTQKTTWAGIGAIVAGLAAAVTGDLSEGAAGIAAGIGLIFSADAQ